MDKPVLLSDKSDLSMSNVKAPWLNQGPLLAQ